MLDTYEIGRHRVAIASRGEVLPATPYSLFLADHIPEMQGQTVVDLGTGSGILGIVARLQGAARVYVLDINPEAIENRDGECGTKRGAGWIPTVAVRFDHAPLARRDRGWPHHLQPGPASNAEVGESWRPILRGG